MKSDTIAAITIVAMIATTVAFFTNPASECNVFVKEDIQKEDSMKTGASTMPARSHCRIPR
jgi:hypothetical protein